PAMTTLRELLAGGDRRSQARSKQALARVVNGDAPVADLVALVGDDDWLVSMRALDLLEKLAHSPPPWAAPHSRLFLAPPPAPAPRGAAAERGKWEVPRQVVPALPLFAWTPADQRRVEAILRRDAGHPQTFVNAWALDSLATRAASKPSLKAFVRSQLRKW